MKLRSFVVYILFMAMLICIAFPMQAASAETTPVILLSGKTNENEVVVTATLRNNDGISTMLLNLEYDKDKLTLSGCEREEKTAALSGLDLVSSGSYDIYPYILTWSGDGNDASNGKLLTLRFTVKENVDGQAEVTFTYKRDRDIIYYVDGDYKTRNVMTDTLRIDISSGETTAIDSDINEEDVVFEEKNKNTALVVSIVVGGTCIAVFVVGIPWFVVKRKRV